MLCYSIQIDWVFIDTIIIILLFLLLLSVRVFKSTHRWRSSFSNEALKKFSFLGIFETINQQSIFTRKWFLTRNSSLIEEKSNKPVFLILRTNQKSKLLNILTEGLSSYGFTVINIRIKMKNYQSIEKSEKTISKEILSFISSIIKMVNERELIKNSKYVILNQSSARLPIKAFQIDQNNKGMILINPKINKRNAKNFIELIDNGQQNSQIFTIFSKKSILFSDNKNLKHLLKEVDNSKIRCMPLITLDKAKKSFKYHETIILGMIIDIIENKLMLPRASN